MIINCCVPRASAEPTSTLFSCFKIITFGCFGIWLPAEVVTRFRAASDFMKKLVDDGYGYSKEALAENGGEFMYVGRDFNQNTAEISESSQSIHRLAYHQPQFFLLEFEAQSQQIFLTYPK